MKSTRNLLLLFAVLAITACGGVDQSELKNLKSECERMSAQLSQNEALIQTLRDSIAILKFPADQRLNKINALISSGDYNEAKKAVAELVSIFPESKEAKNAESLNARIDDLIAKKIAEEQRIKALGFKALKTSSTITIDYNKVVLSSFSIGNTMTFDSYSYEYHYFTADRGNKYVSASMSVTSEDKNPQLPQLALYKIEGDKMFFKGTFLTRFAHWEDYGTYLGNYNDNRNDFSKTSTVKFKVGIEIGEDVLKEAYAIVLKKENGLTRSYERFQNPPVSYIGTVSYPNSLSLEDFTKEGSQYVAVKVANL